MSQNKNVSLERSAPQQPRPSNVYVGVGGSDSLCISPKRDHKSENYEDLQLEFNPLVFSSLEQYLPPHMLNLTREVKVQYMRNILLRYLPESERIRVDHFERWVHATKFRIMRPNIMNQYGAVLDDFGLEAMLDRLMSDFIRPMSRGFHVDDSEVSLNICLGDKFSGGELFFRGVRCDEHVNSDIQPVENFDYYHVPGHAILHPGRHRHGARPTTSGNRINLILWCRSVMSQNQHSVPQQPRPSGGHVTARVVNLNSDRLCVSPKRDHKSENYEDLQLDFNPHVFGSLEQYLPPHVLNLSREVKVRYMRNILLRYFPENDRNREIFNYSHVPGHAILHPGRQRHGARPTTSGNRMNLIIWCRRLTRTLTSIPSPSCKSSFKENDFRRSCKKHTFPYLEEFSNGRTPRTYLKASRLGKWRRFQNDCSGWCGECKRKKNEEASKHADANRSCTAQLIWCIPH
ncbi:putative PKHD-type hydroxylase [Vigna angularis]|uniref:Putative PKHD-type hydroxylase n=1 Tax=Phaseolus angularis TaxID=3914 RepID=A0A8T0KQ46_PHAAN|nr:putative PKHD-type hydroxylase [Vigna angularis]